MTIGRWRVDRQYEKEPERHHGLAKERDSDTDVFSAVRADEAPTGEIPAQAQTEERTAAVATAERDAPTESIPTAGREAPTETIPKAGDDAKTETIPTDPRHAKPGSEKE